MHRTVLLCVLVLLLWNSKLKKVLGSQPYLEERQYFPYNRSSTATGRLFAVTVPQNPCRSSSASSSDAGVCYPKKLCQKKGGTIINTATDICGPVGSCCLFTIKPTSSSRAVTVNEKISTIVPNTDFSSNMFSFPKMTGYCQLKVEFVEFTYQPTPPSSPAQNGLSTCSMESLTFSGSVTVSRFVICGAVPPERPFYLSYGPTGENIKLMFQSLRPIRGNFKLRITQVSCDSDERVDDHCLLQYNEGSGQVESFGYGSYQIAPQEYSVCIGNPSSSRIGQWSMCTQTPPSASVVSPFYLSTFFGPGPDPVLTPRSLYGVYGDTTCDRTSYVNVAQRDKFCGAYFPVTPGGPLNMLHVRFQADDLTKFTTAGAEPSLTRIQPNSRVCSYPVLSTAGPDMPIFHTCRVNPFTTDTCSCSAIPAGSTARTNDPSDGPATGFCLQYN